MTIITFRLYYDSARFISSIIHIYHKKTRTYSSIISKLSLAYPLYTVYYLEHMFSYTKHLPICSQFPSILNIYTSTSKSINMLRGEVLLWSVLILGLQIFNSHAHCYIRQDSFQDKQQEKYDQFNIIASIIQ